LTNKADFGLLVINGTSLSMQKYPVLPIANYTPTLNQQLTLAGYPLELPVSYSTGLVLSTNATLANTFPHADQVLKESDVGPFIAITAYVWEGFSGSPLLDSAGSIVGVLAKKDFSFDRNLPLIKQQPLIALSYSTQKYKNISSVFDAISNNNYTVDSSNISPKLNMQDQCLFDSLNYSQVRDLLDQFELASGPSSALTKTDIFIIAYISTVALGSISLLLACIKIKNKASSNNPNATTTVP